MKISALVKLRYNNSVIVHIPVSLPRFDKFACSDTFILKWEYIWIVLLRFWFVFEDVESETGLLVVEITKAYIKLIMFRAL